MLGEHENATADISLLYNMQQLCNRKSHTFLSSGEIPFPLHMRERLFQLKKASWKSEGFKNTHCQRTVMKLSQTHRIIYKSHYHIYRLPLSLHAALSEENANL